MLKKKQDIVTDTSILKDMFNIICLITFNFKQLKYNTLKYMFFNCEAGLWCCYVCYIFILLLFCIFLYFKCSMPYVCLQKIWNIQIIKLQIYLGQHIVPINIVHSHFLCPASLRYKQFWLGHFAVSNRKNSKSYPENLGKRNFKLCVLSCVM